MNKEFLQSLVDLWQEYRRVVNNYNLELEEKCGRGEIPPDDLDDMKLEFNFADFMEHLQKKHANILELP
jgi:hypothetical protein